MAAKRVVTAAATPKAEPPRVVTRRTRPPVPVVREGADAREVSQARRDLSPVMTVDEVAVELRISRGLAFAAVRDGTLPSVRVGRRILVPRERLAAFVRGEA